MTGFIQVNWVNRATYFLSKQKEEECSEEQAIRKQPLIFQDWQGFNLQEYWLKS